MPALICLDTETTGDAKEDRVIQLAFLVAEDGEAALRKVNAIRKQQAMQVLQIENKPAEGAGP